MIVSKVFKISGKVQNVGFRFYTHKKAHQYNISGFVQNKADGSVYIEAEGEALHMEYFEKWCRKGPDWARVPDFVSYDQPPMNYSGFKVK